MIEDLRRFEAKFQIDERWDRTGFGQGYLLIEGERSNFYFNMK